MTILPQNSRSANNPEPQRQKAQKTERLTLDIAEERLAPLIEEFGREFVFDEMHKFVCRREDFLDRHPAIRAAATVAGGFLIIDYSKLNPRDATDAFMYVIGGLN